MHGEVSGQRYADNKAAGIHRFESQGFAATSKGRSTGDWTCVVCRPDARKHLSAKVLKGFNAATVLEVVEDHDGSTYRAMYKVGLADVVYVLYVFQKKSKSGISTPKHEIDKIKARLKEAEITYANHIEEIAS